MTRKDFELIAEVIREHTDRAGLFRDEVKYMAENMADRLATTNANFKRERFLTACGVK